MRSRRARRLATMISTLALVVAVILAVLMLLPSLLGYERYVITTGSMKPTLPVGSIAYDRVVPVDTLKVGDIITFLPPREYGIKSPVTHRIVEIDVNGIDVNGERRTVFRTKGDNNSAVDPWHLVFDQPKVALLAHHIPYVGYIYLFLSRRWVQIALIGVPAILIAIGMGFLLWQTAGEAVREKRRQEAEAARQSDDEASEAARSLT